MSIQVEPFGTNFTVVDLKATAAFYGEIYPHDKVLEGEFAGIPFISVMRNGEVLACAFQKAEGNPLADSFPTIKVESVAAYQETVKNWAVMSSFPKITALALICRSPYAKISMAISS